MVKGLEHKEISEIRDRLDKSSRPLFFFDSDADGLASFLLLYRYKKDGKGVIVKMQPRLDTNFVRQVTEYQPDLIVILDIAVLTQDFVDEAKVPIIHIDHHGPYDIKGIKYYNPRKKSKDHIPTSYMCYQIAQQDIWIAMTGIVGDWFLKPLRKEFTKEYPDLLPKSVKTEPEALFTTDIGKLAKVFSFIMKGTAAEAMKYIRALSRIDAPDEILNQATARGRFIYKKFSKLDRQYTKILEDALIQAKEQEGKLFIYSYPESKTAFTSDLANEIMFHHPDKVLLITRENNDEMKCSLRSKNINIKDILEEVLPKVDGYGGGHPSACGCSVHKDNFKRFTELFEDALSGS